MPSGLRLAPQARDWIVQIVNVSFALQFKGGETARIAVVGPQCLGVIVEIIVPLDGMSEKFRSRKASELAARTPDTMPLGAYR
jgi:hypothetical protein